MSGKTLVAGIGNIFLGDDGFGVAVARQLMGEALPDGVVVRDYGTRGLDLALDLLDDFERVVFVDVMEHGGEPGALQVMQPEIDDKPIEGMNAHELTPAAVLATARRLGFSGEDVYVVGCEPSRFVDEEGPTSGMSPVVTLAAGRAADLVLDIVRRL